MKIAFISTMEGYPWGGSEELWSQAARRLLASNVQVVASVKTWPRTPAPLQMLGTEGCSIVFRRPYPNSLLMSAIRKLTPNHDFKMLDRQKPDLCVISQGWFTEGVLWFEASRQRGIPYVVLVECAGIGPLHDPHELERLREGFEGAAACYFVSTNNLDVVNRQLATKLLNASFVANPFNVSFRANPPWPAEGPVQLACVARLDTHSKGQDILFEVLHQNKWRNRPMTVTLFGAGPNQQSLERLAGIYGLNNVRFAGHVQNIEELWRSHHALVLPSRIEGSPLAVIEAMLCGRPCIVTDVGGCRELVDDELTGFVAAAPTPGLLDDAMERAWARRSEWQQMGYMAAQTVRKRVPEDPAMVFAEALLKLSR